MRLFTSKEARSKLIKVIIIILIIVAITFYFGSSILSYFKNGAEAKEMIQSFGAFAPIIMIALLIIIVLLAFVSQIPLIVASGFAFGAIPAFCYAFIGFFIGGTIAFFLARKFGRPFVIKIITKNAMEKLDNYSGVRLNIILFLFFLIPIFPDAICYVAGLTNIKYRTFVLLSLIGRIPTIILFTVAGNSIANTNYTLGIILLGIIIICATIILIFRQRIETHVVNRFEKK